MNAQVRLPSVRNAVANNTTSTVNNTTVNNITNNAAPTPQPTRPWAYDPNEHPLESLNRRINTVQDAYQDVRQVNGRLQQLLENQRSAARFNGSLSATFAALDARRFGREVEMANATSGSASVLAGSINRLEQALQPLLRVRTNFFNVAGASIANTLSFGLENLNNTAGQFGKAMPMLSAVFDYLEKVAAANSVLEFAKGRIDGKGSLPPIMLEIGKHLETQKAYGSRPPNVPNRPQKGAKP